MLKGLVLSYSITGIPGRSESKDLGFSGRIQQIVCRNRWDYRLREALPQSATNRKVSSSVGKHNRPHARIDGIIPKDPSTFEHSESKDLGFNGRVPRITCGNRWHHLTASLSPKSVTNRKASSSVGRHNRSHAGINGITTQYREHRRAYRLGEPCLQWQETTDRMPESMALPYSTTSPSERIESDDATLEGVLQQTASGDRW